VKDFKVVLSINTS